MPSLKSRNYRSIVRACLCRVLYTVAEYYIRTYSNLALHLFRSWHT